MREGVPRRGGTVCGYWIFGGDQLESEDLRRDKNRLTHRYAILVTPSRTRYHNTPADFWSAQTPVGSAALGDVCAAQCRINSVGITDKWLVVHAPQSDIRALMRRYQKCIANSRRR